MNAQLACTNESPNAELADAHLTFHNMSWTDPVGRVFWRNGELFRGIRQERAPLYKQLLTSGLVADLVQAGLLVDTWDSGHSTTDFPLILKHKTIRTVSFASEWCGGQMKAAALRVLDLELALRKHNLTLGDTNPWNMLFDGINPVFVDFSSIMPLANTNEWPARSLFYDFFFNPLTLFQNDLSRVARRMLWDPWVGITNDDLRRLGVRPQARTTARRYLRTVAKQIGRSIVPRSLRPSVKAGLKSTVSRLSHTLSGNSAITHIPGAETEIRELRQQVSDVDTSRHKTRWADYYVNNFPALTQSPEWTDKHRSINAVLAQHRPKTVLDVGANRGWYSQLAAHHGAQVIAADSDETSLNEMFDDAQRLCAKATTVVYMDIRFPEPGQGPAYHLFAPASERFNSEMVLALAVVHHLVFTWHLSFDQILDNFAMFCKRWLVIEFVGPDDAVVNRLWDRSSRPWYNKEVFKSALSDRFRILQELPSDSGGLDGGPDDRVIFVCERL